MTVLNIIRKISVQSTFPNFNREIAIAEFDDCGFIIMEQDWQKAE